MSEPKVTVEQEWNPERTESRDYFAALVRHESAGDYPLYFVNNTESPIDEMITQRGDSPPPEMSMSIDDLRALLKGHNGIPPYRYSFQGSYVDWDFDWTNNLYVILRA